MSFVGAVEPGSPAGDGPVSAGSSMADGSAGKPSGAAASLAAGRR